MPGTLSRANRLTAIVADPTELARALAIPQTSAVTGAVVGTGNLAQNTQPDSGRTRSLGHARALVIGQANGIAR